MVRERGDDEAGDMNETTDSTSDRPGTASGGPTPGSPNPGAAPDPHSGHRSEWDQVKDVGGLQRPADRMVAGVAAGLARHLNIDPLVLRVAFVVLSFFGGAGIIIYGAMWLLLPEDGQSSAPIHLDERSRGVALIAVVALASLSLLGDSWGLFWAPWPLVLIAVAVWYFWNRSTKKDDRLQEPAYSSSDAPAPYGPAPYGPAPYGSGPAYAQPQWPAPPSAGLQRPPLTRPRDPRRRGPVLFWFTLALIALSLGVLGTLDLAGVAIVDSAYPTLALTISGAMLVLGAFWGRAGGIIVIALVSMLATLGAVSSERWQDDELVFAPTSSSEVRDYYELRRGELTLDLTGLSELEALGGREIQIDGGAGRIEVRLPADLNVDLEADVGVGSIRLLDQRSTEGLGVTANATSASSSDAPQIKISTDLGVGEIVVIQQ